MNDRLSIIVAEGARLTTTRIILGCLYKNMRYKDNEIVFVGDRIDREVGDWARVGNYRTVREYLEYWMLKFPNFTLVDGDWNREECDRERSSGPRTPVYESLNAGIDAASNDWIMVVGSDEYYCPDFDHNLMKHFHEFDPLKHIFIPVWGVLTHPRGDPSIGPDYVPDDHVGSKGHAAYYIPKAEWETKPLLESGLNAHAKEHARDEVHVEPCAHRWQLFYWNHVIHRELLDVMKRITIGPGAYGVAREPGPQCDECRFKRGNSDHGNCDANNLCEREMGTALDIEFDDLLWHGAGAYKVGCLDSICYHIKSFRSRVGSREGYFLFDLGEP